MNQCTYAADVISMCMRDQHIDRLDARKIEPSEFRESFKRKVDQNHVIIIDKIRTSVIICKGRTFSKKIQHISPSILC